MFTKLTNYINVLRNNLFHAVLSRRDFEQLYFVQRYLDAES